MLSITASRMAFSWTSDHMSRPCRARAAPSRTMTSIVLAIASCRSSVRPRRRPRCWASWSISSLTLSTMSRTSAKSTLIVSTSGPNSLCHRVSPIRSWTPANAGRGANERAAVASALSRSASSIRTAADFSACVASFEPANPRRRWHPRGQELGGAFIPGQGVDHRNDRDLRPLNDTRGAQRGLDLTQGVGTTRADHHRGQPVGTHPELVEIGAQPRNRQLRRPHARRRGPQQQQHQVGRRPHLPGS